ncbi:hypothetical protein PQE75_gp126 [Bacillus phage vB_BcoS-136]|uniref:Uncharacterized protein n=1 Tax=Bacillus phage vB_BcoS-136 TaxID=2419619 RepID=A0A3G3BVT3_9CAUD|nr:hypothetical protein PQE75_gp126 [Bacillus phage vB_BcoS-136]AYP68353.1 hypothetical protein vBBcoS136_00239 [Bacillus phage vB_BcoS-136]
MNLLSRSENMIKRLLCKHEYDCYHVSRYVPFLTVICLNKWHFICKKCNSKSILYELDIDDVWEDIREKVAKEKAMGVNNSEYEDFVYILGSSIYRGKGAYYLSKKYSKYKQRKTVG